MPEPSLTAEQARALAQQILARPEYARFRREPTFLQDWVDGLAAWLREMGDRVAGWLPSWVADGWNALWRGLHDLLGAAFGDDALTVVLRLALAMLVLGAFGLLVYHVLRQLRANAAEEEAESGRGAATGPALIEEADRFARQGRFLEAAHCTQLASLQLLLQKRCLELERSDPNRTLRQRLRRAPLPEALRERFLSLLDRLEGHWFRDRHEDRDLYGEWRSLHAQLEGLPGPR